MAPNALPDRGYLQWCHPVKKKRSVPAERAVRSAAVLLLLAAAACIYTAEPLADLSGTWQAPATPSGRGMVLSLAMRGDSVTGFGYQLGIEGRVKDTLRVAGRAAGASVWLAVARTPGDSLTFSGRIVSANELSGTWKAPGQTPTALDLVRQ